jgi:type II secretory ATPase GspE/PulE/Tfp pilus assembly ATPase PilB-like protein
VIGEILKEKGIIRDEHISIALKEQKTTGERLGNVLIRMGFATEEELAIVLAEQSEKPFIELKDIRPDPQALRMIPLNLAKQKTALPISTKGNTIEIAVADPYDLSLLDALGRVSGMEVKLLVGPAPQIRRKINQDYYLLEHPVDEEIDALVQPLKRNPEHKVDVDRLTDLILISAVSKGSSDVHITPTDRSTHVSFRTDGVLGLQYSLPEPLHVRLIANIKIKSGMDISVQRKPQDGRMSFEFVGESYDLRVSTIPSVNGENLVSRILYKSTGIFSLPFLGFSPNNLATIQSLFDKPYGIVLVVGPTGSGKTTTLYAALRQMNTLEKNVMTVEDPVEYTLPLVRQTQVNEKAGYNFSMALRTFLRQDPDVILVGEMRDEETAELGVRASLTGHLVLSTLHTNDAVGVIPRLRDMNINNFLLSSSMLGIIAQRLVRKVCPYCKEEYTPDPKEAQDFDIPLGSTLFRGRGCTHCSNKGYLGRTVISEVMTISDEIARLIAEDVPPYKIEEAARREGMTTLREDAIAKVLQGITTLEEARRVVG